MSASRVRQEMSFCWAGGRPSCARMSLASSILLISPLPPTLAAQFWGEIESTRDEGIELGQAAA